MKKKSLLFKSESLPNFLQYQCKTLKTQKNKDKLKTIQIENEQKYSQQTMSLKKLKEKRIIVSIKNRNLKKEKEFISKTFKETKLECELNELKANNKLEELKTTKKKDEELLKDKLKKEKEYIKNENKIVINNKIKKFDIKLLKEKNNDLNSNLNIDQINYEKLLEQEKRKNEKIINRKECQINHKRQKTYGNLEGIKIKNELENKIKQIEANKEILLKNIEYSKQKAKRYNILIDKVQAKNEQKIMEKNKLKGNKETTNTFNCSEIINIC